MSLQVWLPLNGNLNNNGVADAVITNSNATVDANGKIGSCYRFNKNAYMLINKEVVNTITSGECSFCLWLKINSFNAAWDTYVQLGLGTTPWTAYTMGLLRDNTASNLVFTVSNGSTASNNSYKTPDITLGEWFHIACIYKTGHCLIYINGTLYADYTTSIVPNFSAITGIYLGGLASVYKIDGYVNDFRIYDHALSAKEVKEISKGLVLHMPLNNNGAPNPNLLPHTNVSTYGLGYMVTYSSGTIAIDNEVLFNGKPTIRITPSTSSTSSGGHNAYNSSVNLIAGKPYTYSCYIKSTVADEWTHSSLGHFQTTGNGASHNISSTVYNQKDVPANQWVKVSVTFTCSVNNSFRSFFIYFANTSQTIWISDVKLEEGNEATPWVPHTSDSDYAGLGFNTATVYDTSGYGNNGTMSSNKPTAISGAPRYQSCMLFNGSNNYIVCGRSSMVKDAITVNVWAYMDDWSTYNGRIASCTEGGGWNFEPGSGKMNFAVGTGVSSNTYKSVLSTQTLASLSGWVMFTGTYDGFDTKIYINGVLSNTTVAYTTKTPVFYNASNGLFIGCEAINSTTAPGGAYFKGKISDFRIYATALSAEDIAELYNVSASVDNTGKTFAMDYVEI